MNVCEYCQKKFSTKYTVLRHQRTSKYCLNIQNNDTLDYKCGNCEKTFPRLDTLHRHEKKCLILPTNKDINKLVDIIGSLQEQISILAANQHIKFGHNITDNLQPITDKDLKEYLDSLSIEFIQRGAKGYADYAGSYPFRDKLICTDRSRKKIKYKTEAGILTDDGRALAQRFFQAIAEKNTVLINKEYSSLQNRLTGIINTNNNGEEDIADILKRATFIQDLLIKTNNAAKGIDDEFVQIFLSHLSKNIS